MELRERAPAKINLALRVLGRRSDGYHELDSIFVPLALADSLRISIAPARSTAIRVLALREDRITCRCSFALPLGGRPRWRRTGFGDERRRGLDGRQNLAARAAARYLERAGIEARIAISIVKRVWIGAGLGGGSSDAAATLRALDRAFHAAVPAAELEAIALSLGADVPFFLAPADARVRGIGERVDRSVVVARPLPLVLLNPRRPLATAAVYEALGLARGAAGPSVPFDVGELAALAATPAALVANDLERPALALEPAIDEMKRALRRAGAIAASMSGSGPTVFGIFADAHTARRAAEELRARTEHAVALA
jgi:4-diphosphocytidyl-2-C-methyl-D-erythritol kinase